MNNLLIYSITILGLINLFRFFFIQIATNIYDIKLYKGIKDQKERNEYVSSRSDDFKYNPRISVIIPAHNEEMGVIRTLKSVLKNDYVNKQVIVVNDGSTDKTLSILKNFQRKNKGWFTIVNQENGGKASALNRGIKNYSEGELVMVLDADSLIEKNGISKMVEHFRNKNVIACASNVKVLGSRKILGLSQRVEYLISYRMKRGLSVLKMEYIIGGVGSTFRKSKLLEVGGYDEDTITEDIDLTLKLINRFGNKDGSIFYAADVSTFTEHVLTLKSLIRQRFRWKYGRMQSFLKNKNLFFSKDKSYDKRLTWLQLPYAFFGELALFLEPIFVIVIIVVSLVTGDYTSLFLTFIIVTGMITLIVSGEDTENFKGKIKLGLSMPFMYILMYILTFVEFVALISSLFKIKQLRTDMATSKWEHVERSGGKVQLK